MSLFRWAFQTVLMTAVAGVAQVPAVVGIYGLTYCTAARRRSEIGSRVALGARCGAGCG
jgi:hypothetical protein